MPLLMAPPVTLPHASAQPLHLGHADCSTSTVSSPHLAARFFRAGAILYIGLEPNGKRSPRWAVSGALEEASSGAGRASRAEAVPVDLFQASICWARAHIVSYAPDNSLVRSIFSLSFQDETTSLELTLKGGFAKGHTAKKG